MELGSNKNGDGKFDINDDDNNLDAPFANSRSFLLSSLAIGDTGKGRGICTHSSATLFPSCAIATLPPPTITGVAIDVDIVAFQRRVGEDKRLPPQGCLPPPVGAFPPPPPPLRALFMTPPPASARTIDTIVASFSTRQFYPSARSLGVATNDNSVGDDQRLDDVGVERRGAGGPDLAGLAGGGGRARFLLLLL